MREPFSKVIRNAASDWKIAKSADKVLIDLRGRS
jgi:hypothetical protein